MKTRKFLLTALLLSFGLTGCYTQLEYSQKVKRITDEKPVEGYSWGDESEERANLTKADSIYIAETYGAKVDPYREEDTGDYEDEEYIPVEYKNYDVIEKYDACNCNPYKTYVIYNSYYPASYWHYSGWHHHYRHYPYDYYNYAYFSPFYRWHWRYHFGFSHHYHRSFGLAFHFGYPYGYYYDPFFYDPFFYGYRSPIFYGGYYFRGGFAGTVRSVKSDRRFGRRSIGADRVRSGNRSTVRTRSGITRSKEGTTSRVRSRSTGVTRTKGTVKRSRGDTKTRSRGTIKRSRSGNKGSSVRSRGGLKVKRSRGNNDQDAVISNTRLRTRSNTVHPSTLDRSRIESRIRNQRVKINNDRKRSRSSFFGRFRSFIDPGSSIRNNSQSRNSSRYFKTPSRSRSKFGKSSSRSRSSSGTKVKSRSRTSKSSGSRSRSSSGGSSSKKRSRGNN